eukprot:8538457-Pyramimonas_sp.AAC.1
MQTSIVTERPRGSSASKPTRRSTRGPSRTPTGSSTEGRRPSSGASGRSTDPVRCPPSRSPRRSGAGPRPTSSCPAGLCTGIGTRRCGLTSARCRSRPRPDSASGATWNR